MGGSNSNSNPTPDAARMPAAEAFRSAHSLHGEKETKEWLEAKSLSVEAFKAHLESRIISNKVKVDTDR